MAAKPIEVPAMGDSITEGSIASIDKPVGSTVQADDIIAQIETDKVTIDVRAPESGTVTEVLVAEGDTVTVGQHIVSFEPGEVEASAAAFASATTKAAALAAATFSTAARAASTAA